MDDDAFAARLDAAEAEAAPFLRALGLVADDVEPWSGHGKAADIGRFDLAAIPDVAIPSVRIDLLRRIGDSDLGTAASTHGRIREALARRRPELAVADVATELRLCHRAIGEQARGSLGWLRLPLLGPTLDAMERLAPGPMAAVAVWPTVRALLDLLTAETLTVEVAATDLRYRMLVAWLRFGASPLPPEAFDAGDAFGERMRLLVETDPALGSGLAPLAPIAAGATSGMPSKRQRAAIDDLTDATANEEIGSSVLRVASALVGAPLIVRGPGFVTLRPANQRMARAAAWAIPVVAPDEAADVLGDVGLRLATSGRADNQARDGATASTCAAMLGEIGTPPAVAALARMRARVRNKPVRSQVEKALSGAADRLGVALDALLDASLPTIGLDASGSRRTPVGDWSATLSVRPDGRVAISWVDPDGSDRAAPTAPIRERDASTIADLEDRRNDIEALLAEERMRLEGWLREDRRWSIEAWDGRFRRHPIGRIHAARLVWQVLDEADIRPARMVGDGWVSAAERPVPSTPASVIGLWHPVDAEPAEIAAWREALQRNGIEPPFAQVDREVYDASQAPDAVQDRRFADRAVDYPRFRALLGSRGWSSPMLGPWDQGDQAVAVRNLPNLDLRAEFGHVPTEPHDPRAFVDATSVGAVRFTRVVDGIRFPVLLRDVPPRVFSEVLRDVDLFTSVAAGP